jgi:hypothetical protein
MFTQNGAEEAEQAIAAVSL